MNCGMSTIKYLLFLFNLLCALCGVLLIALGAMFLAQDGNLDKVVEEMGMKPLTTGILVLGIVIFIIAFFGCCGAIRESYCLTTMYSICLFLVLVLNIVLLVFVFMQKGSLPKILDEVLEKMWEERKDNNAFDALQASVHCCGLDTFNGWGVQFPQSCCPNPQQSCIVPVFRTCKSAVNDIFMKNADIVSYSALGIVGVELVGFIFACCLANHIRNRKRRSSY